MYNVLTYDGMDHITITVLALSFYHNGYELYLCDILHFALDIRYHLRKIE